MVTHTRGTHQERQKGRRSKDTKYKYIYQKENSETNSDVTGRSTDIPEFLRGSGIHTLRLAYDNLIFLKKRTYPAVPQIDKKKPVLITNHNPKTRKTRDDRTLPNIMGGEISRQSFGRPVYVEHDTTQSRQRGIEKQ